VEGLPPQQAQGGIYTCRHELVGLSLGRVDAAGPALNTHRYDNYLEWVKGRDRAGRAEN